MSMFSVKYKRLRIVPSISATRELIKEGKTIFFVLEILEEGYDAPRRRKEGTIEMWLDKGKKTYNAVIVKNYDEIVKKDIWVLIHFGKFTRRK